MISWPDLLDLDLSRQPSRKRAVAFHMLGATAGNVLLMIQGFLLVPLYLHYLGDRLYGFWLASGGLLAWLGVLDLGISTLVLQRCGAAYGRRDLAEVGRYFRAGAMLIAGFAALLLVLALAVSHWVPLWLSVDESWRRLVSGTYMLAALSLALGMGNEFARNFCASVQRAGVPASVETIGSIFSLLVTVGGLLGGLGLWSLPLGFFVRSTLILAVNGTYAWRLVRPCGGSWRIEPRVFADFAKLGPAVVCSRVANGLTRQAEPLLITIFLRPELTVVYTVTQRALAASEFFSNVLIGTTAGAFSHLFGEKNAVAISGAVRDTGVLVVTISSFISLGYAVGNAGFVQLWVGGDRFGGQALTTGLALASMAMLGSRYLQSLLGATGDIAYTSYLAAGEGVLRVGIACALIKWLHLPAFPVAVILVSLLTASLSWRRLHKIFPSVVQALRGTLPILALGIGLVAAATAVSFWLPHGSWLAWGVSVALVAAGLGGLLLIPAPVRALVVPRLLRVGCKIQGKLVPLFGPGTLQQK